MNLIKHPTPAWRAMVGVLLAGLAVVAAAQATFFATQTTLNGRARLYRFTATGAVSTFLLNGNLSGMTTVPPGMTVGTMNGGALEGEIICYGGVVFRLDDAFGPNPHLVQIGVSNSLFASPVFAGNRMFSIGAVIPGVVAMSEIDPITFTEISRELVGVPGQTGGMFHVGGLRFRFDGNLYDRLYEHTYGSGNFSTDLGPTASHDYAGFEAFGGSVYATYAVPESRRFVFGQINADTGAFTLIRDLDAYLVGVTGLAVAEPFPNQPPRAGVVRVYTEVPCCESTATLDASPSWDPEGQPLTYEWFYRENLIAIGVNPTISLPKGIYQIKLVVTDTRRAQSVYYVAVNFKGYEFDGFLAPISGTGGDQYSPFKDFNQGSSIPFKFRASCCGENVIAGIHTLVLAKWTPNPDPDILWDLGPWQSATSTDGATVSNQFRLTGSMWHYNLDTAPLSAGIWIAVATLSDGTSHSLTFRLN